MTNKNQSFFFTYGSHHKFPFQGGWTEISGNITKDQAVGIFRVFHPDLTHGIINCAFVYDKASFNKTDMSTTGNLGKKCVEFIKITYMEEE